MVTGTLLVVLVAVASISSAAPIFDLDGLSDTLCDLIHDFVDCSFEEYSEDTSGIGDKGSTSVNNAVIVHITGTISGQAANPPNGMPAPGQPTSSPPTPRPPVSGPPAPGPPAPSPPGPGGNGNGMPNIPVADANSGSMADDNSAGMAEGGSMNSDMM